MRLVKSVLVIAVLTLVGIGCSGSFGSTEHFDGILQPSGALQGPAAFNIPGRPPVLRT
jgi:hypothetical protein